MGSCVWRTQRRAGRPPRACRPRLNVCVFFFYNASLLRVAADAVTVSVRLCLLYTILSENGGGCCFVNGSMASFVLGLGVFVCAGAVWIQLTNRTFAYERHIYMFIQPFAK